MCRPQVINQALAGPVRREATTASSGVDSWSALGAVFLSCRRQRGCKSIAGACAYPGSAIHHRLAAGRCSTVPASEGSPATAAAPSGQTAEQSNSPRLHDGSQPGRRCENLPAAVCWGTGLCQRVTRLIAGQKECQDTEEAPCHAKFRRHF